MIDTDREEHSEQERKREEMKGGEVPEGREVHGESRDPLTGLRKCKPPHIQREREDPFSGAQIANGGRNEVFERTTGPGQCQCWACGWAFH